MRGVLPLFWAQRQTVLQPRTSRDVRGDAPCSLRGARRANLPHAIPRTHVLGPSSASHSIDFTLRTRGQLVGL